MSHSAASIYKAYAWCALAHGDLVEVVQCQAQQAVEMSYFRLTSKPDPAVVRPELILKQALDRLVRPRL